MSDLSLVPVPTEQAGATLRATAARRSSPTSATACPAASRPRRCAWPSSTCSQGRRRGEPRGAGAADARADARPATCRSASSRGANGWLRRNSGLLGLLAVLVLCLIAGPARRPLGQPGSKTPAKQVVEVEGPVAASRPRRRRRRRRRRPRRRRRRRDRRPRRRAKAEAEASEGRSEGNQGRKGAAAEARKVAPAKIKKLTSSSGKKHQEEINALGAQPIETG